MRRGPLSGAYRTLRSFLFDPVALLLKVRALPHFARNAWLYQRRHAGRGFDLRVFDLRYTSYERFLNAGTAQGHYFHQDLWAARRVAESGIRELVDVGSRVDGFVAHVLTFCHVKYVDIRPLPGEVENLEYIEGSIVRMPFADGSVPLLSCLHVIEHVGLGRYGDPVDPSGPAAAAAELARVLAPGGALLLGTPVGRERLVFDAHRVFDPRTVVNLFADLELAEFSLIDDEGKCIQRDASMEAACACEYGCGLFMFRKPAATVVRTGP